MADQQTTPKHPNEQPDDANQTPATTQEELARSSGAGIRGGYGDSDQTNGLEGGGQNTPPDNTSPEEKQQN